MIRYLILLLCTVLVFGCTNVDSVLFATKTSLSVVEVDSKPASLTVAYDRVEGYVAPRYSNGALPPVLASIESDGKIFGAGVRQVFATGAAAHSLALSQPEDSADNQESQQLLWGPTMPKKLAFFGTSTSTGLKVGSVETFQTVLSLDTSARSFRSIGYPLRSRDVNMLGWRTRHPIPKAGSTTRAP